jgi:flagellar biosynthesis protein FlhF
MFEADDMNAAMNDVREALGDSAVIIATTRKPGGKGVSITAAVESEELPETTAPPPPKPMPTPKPTSPAITKKEPELPPYITKSVPKPPPAPYSKPKAAPKKEPTQKSTPSNELLGEIEKILLFHNTPNFLLDKLLKTGKELSLGSGNEMNQVNAGLTKILEHCFNFEPIALDNQGYRIMVVGMPGIGKTLSIVKMAATIAMSRLPVTVITIDNKRAGGVEQLSAFTDILGIGLKVAASPAELKAELEKVDPLERVLIDSGGCNAYELDSLKEIESYLAVSTIEPVLVSPAGGDCIEALECNQNFAYLPIKRMIASRVDTARRLGSILVAADSGPFAFSHMSSTAEVLGALQKLDATQLSRILIRHKLEN